MMNSRPRNTTTTDSTGASSNGRMMMRSISDAGDEGERERDDERRPIGQAGLDQHQRDIGGEHRLLALREIDVVRRLIDHHQRERDAGIDAAIGEAGQELVQERLHAHQYPR